MSFSTNTTTTNTTNNSNSQTTMHHLDANAVPFDPLSRANGQIEDREFLLFSQLQLLNTTLQQLQHQLNYVSIPTLKQLNQQIINANQCQYYILNPVLYYQIQQQQTLAIQNVQLQQSQCQQLQQQINQIQSEYYMEQQRTQTQSLQSQSPQPQCNDEKDIKQSEPIINEPKESINKSLSIITEFEDTHENGSCDPIINIESLIISEQKTDEQICKAETDSETDNKSDEHCEITDEQTHEMSDSDSEIEIEQKSEETIQFSVSELIAFQPKHMEMDWVNNQTIPREIRMVYQNINYKEFMTDITASISRKCTERFSDRKISKDTKIQTMNKLQRILNKLTPTNFDKIASNLMDIISEYVIEKEQIEHVLEIILNFGVEQSVFSHIYAELIQYLCDYLPEINENISDIFRQTVIVVINKLFVKYSDNKTKDKKSFIACLKFCGSLYNADMMHATVIYKGIIGSVMNNDITPTDIEGVCMLFTECGHKLESQNKRNLDRHLKKIKRFAQKFDFRTKFLVEGIEEMRGKGWQERIKKEKPKELDQIREEFAIEQQKIEEAKYGKKYRKYECEYGYDAYEDGNEGYYGKSQSRKPHKRNRYNR